MDILNFHRNVLEEIKALREETKLLRKEQAETNHLIAVSIGGVAITNNLLRELITNISPRYNLTVNFKEKEHNMGTTPTPPTDTTLVGQVTVGVPTETKTSGADGTTSAYQFDPSKIEWTLADPTIASFVVDPATGAATFTALAAGSTSGTVTDSQTAATTSYEVVVTAPTPDSFAINVAFQATT